MPSMSCGERLGTIKITLNPLQSLPVNYLLEEHRKRFANAAQAMRKFIGEKCPTEFFDEIESFMKYVQERDNVEKELERLKEKMEHEKSVIQIILGAATLLVTLLGILLFR